MESPNNRATPLPSRVRTLLFAPAVRPDFVAKLPTRGADVVIIDLEDATPPNSKDEGRGHTRTLAPELIAAGCCVTVRINALSTQWFADDVRHGLIDGLVAVIVPKIETLADLDAIAAALNAAGLPQLGVIAGIETALGVADARELLAHQRVVGAYFGAEDFVVDMGGVRTSSNDEVAFARSAVALAGRLASVPVFDQVVTDFRDETRLVAEAAQARALGYAGKLCIHPAQVAPVNGAFTPSAEEVDRAHRLLTAYESAVESGIAAIAFEGQMVDEPVAVNARRLDRPSGAPRVVTISPLDRLLAIEDIKQLKARYCRYCDQQDWVGYRSLFLDDAVTEYSDATFDNPDVMVDYFAELLEGGNSVHHTHNAEITFSSADEALGIWTLFDRVELAPGKPSPGWNGYARYWETYRRVDGRWYIETLRVERFHRFPLESGGM